MIDKVLTQKSEFFRILDKHGFTLDDRSDIIYRDWNYSDQYGLRTSIRDVVRIGNGHYSKWIFSKGNLYETTDTEHGFDSMMRHNWSILTMKEFDDILTQNEREWQKYVEYMKQNPLG